MADYILPAFSRLYAMVAEAPTYHLVLEGMLLVSVIYLLFRKSYNMQQTQPLSEKEKEELIAEWSPEPLVPEIDQNHVALNPKYIEGKVGKYISIDGREYLNLATLNFLGLVGDSRIEEASKKTLYKYGMGSCGPRGFYGTFDVHLDLEKQLAEYLKVEDAVLYSYGFSTIASAIPAYSKRGDVIFADKGVNFAIQKGIQASRSRVEWFEHNDAQDLERLLQIQAEKDKLNPKKAKVTRRFLIVEGLYLNSGEVCPLPAFVALKWKYKARLFVDESVSFGIMGTTGRGVTEHCGVDIGEVDMVMASLENAVASIGGFVAGTSFVVNHQQLSGLGYCFSASLPPMLSVAASEALRIIENEPSRLSHLRSNAKRIRLGLQQAFENTQFWLQGADESPVYHIKFRTDFAADAEEILDRFVDEMFQCGVALTRARYLNTEEAFLPDPSIRVSVNCELTEKEMDGFIQNVTSVLQRIL